MTDRVMHLMNVCDATWPAARLWQKGAWTLREGAGGGKRVSAATLARHAEDGFEDGDISAAEVAMRAMGQVPLFMIRDGEVALDAALSARVYERIAPVTIYEMPIEALTDRAIPRVTAFCIWEPLAIMAEIWEAGGIGPERLAVMDRAALKTGILARWNEKPAGTGFAAVHDGTCMVHAVEVLPHQRRQGVAGWIMRAAAIWGQTKGADRISVLCTQANTGANALYSALGFEPVGQYHYRKLKA